MFRGAGKGVEMTSRKPKLNKYDVLREIRLFMAAWRLAELARREGGPEFSHQFVWWDHPRVLEHAKEVLASMGNGLKPSERQRFSEGDRMAFALFNHLAKLGVLDPLEGPMRNE